VVNPSSTFWAQRCLTLVIKWVPACSTWQDADLTFSFFTNAHNRAETSATHCNWQREPLGWSAGLGNHLFSVLFFANIEDIVRICVSFWARKCFPCLRPRWTLFPSRAAFRLGTLPRISFRLTKSNFLKLKLCYKFVLVNLSWGHLFRFSFHPNSLPRTCRTDGRFALFTWIIRFEWKSMIRQFWIPILAGQMVLSLCCLAWQRLDRKIAIAN
jgi:hypothetical protein